MQRLAAPKGQGPNSRDAGASSSFLSGTTLPFLSLGARLRRRTATQGSKEGSEKVLGRVLGKGSGEGFWGRVLGKGSGEGFWGRVLGKGSGEGFSEGF